MKNIRVLASLFFLLIPLCALAQSTTLVHGVVRDSITDAPLEFATVSIHTLDGKLLGHATTASNGRFEIKNVPSGQCTLSASFVGYVATTRTLRTVGGTLDAGYIALLEDRVRLNEAVISDIGNTMVVKKDTIEYNASSFKVTEDSMLEDLVKKLPGAEIDSDGKITVGGKEITKIMVDGKTFFSDDPQIASRNLPANMVEKVQVVDRKSDQAQFTGIDDGEEETVLNLTVKPGMKNGWFGNVSAGAGYEDKYQAGGMAATINDNRQLSVIASGNNTNNRGFNDFAGSMMRQGRGSRVNVGGVRMNMGGEGLTTSWLGGVNYHDEWGADLKLGSNYFYNGSETKLNTDSYRQTIFSNDSISDYTQSARSITRTQGHRAAAELEWTLNDKSSIIFRPRIRYGTGNFDESADYTTTAGADSVNTGHSASYGHNYALSFDSDLLFRHKFNTEGRTFSANVEAEYERNNTDGNNYSLTRVFDNAAPDELVDQQYRSSNYVYTLNTRFSYTEPLGNNYYAEIAYGARANYTTSDKETFNDDGSGNYDVPDSDFTNHYTTLFVNQRIEANVRSVREKYNWTVGVNAQPTWLRSEGRGDETFSRNTFNLSPIANFIYHFSDSRQLRIDYRGRTSQPSLSQLQPVPDNSNPLLERTGNPNLDPEFTNNIRLFYRSTDLQSFRTIVTMLHAAVTNSEIVNNNIYELSTGKQLIIPTNVSGAYSVRGFFMMNTPFRRGSRYSILLNTFANYSRSVSLSQTVQTIGDDVDLLSQNSLKNNTQTLNLNQRVRLGYKGDRIDINLSGRAGYSKAWYSLDNEEQPTYWNNSVGADFNWMLPWDLSLASDADYRFYIGYADGYNEPNLVWNAEISKLVFKQKQGTIKIRVFDLLNEGRGTSRTTTENYIEDSVVNTLGRYVMCSFTYRFGSFGSDEQRIMSGPGSWRRRPPR